MKKTLLALTVLMLSVSVLFAGGSGESTEEAAPAAQGDLYSQVMARFRLRIAQKLKA